MNETLSKTILKTNVKASLYLITIFNIFDAIMTLFWVHHGLAAESNPLMNYALSIGPEYFVILKITLVYLGCILIYRHREKYISKLASVVGVLSYGAIVFYHLIGGYLALC